MKRNLFNTVLKTQIEQMRRNTRKLAAGYNQDAVHDLRVAALKVDFALKFFGQTADAGKIKRLKGRIKKIRRLLGAARNLDILSSRTNKDLKKLPLTVPEIEDINTWVESLKHSSQRALSRMLESAGYKGLLDELQGCIGKFVTPNTHFIVQNPFKQTLERVLKYRKKPPHARNLHKIRIAFKKARYACEFLKDIHRTRMRRALKFIVGFQGLLGNRQDSIAVIEILSGSGRSWAQKLIKIEKTNIKKKQKNFRKRWEKDFLGPSPVTELYCWSSWH
ncbi:MAG: CHAD domain-containing protein [Candidatus Omnitrophica bacterium]|nr:CHAD domain-containing protein [Candidatus Omnitrophota bacterium]MDE2222248.1 CHAD domain-containing protein [Candidatus Omnitrophota bacterium]